MKNTDDVLRKIAINTLGLMLDRAPSVELKEKITVLQSSAAGSSSIAELVCEITELKKKLKQG